MLTEQQHKIFTDCAGQMRSAVSDKQRAASDLCNKLTAYNTLLEPPASIRETNRARAKKLWERELALWELKQKIDKAEEYILARPQICTYTSVVDGREVHYVFAGMLPNFEKAPEDETQALQAVDEYHAREIPIARSLTGRKFRRRNSTRQF